VAEFFKGLLVCLQIVALALCVCVLYEMAVQQALKIPYKMCIDLPEQGVPMSPRSDNTA
jgi:hypothetical protein